MEKEYIGYAIECPCCGDIMKLSDDLKESNSRFVVFEKLEDAQKEALKYEGDDGMLTKVLRVKLTIEKNEKVT